jgi:hypothetical protein
MCSLLQVSVSSESSAQATSTTSVQQLVALLRTALADPHGLSLRGIEAAQQGIALLPQHATSSSRSWSSSSSSGSSSWIIEHNPVMTAALLQLAAGDALTENTADFLCSVITRALHVHINPAPLAGAVLSVLSNSSSNNSSKHSNEVLVNHVRRLYGMPASASQLPSTSSNSSISRSALQGQQPWRLLLHTLESTLGSSSSSGSSSRSEGVAALMAAVQHEPPAALPLLCRQACASVKLHCTAQAQQGSDSTDAVVACALDIVAKLLLRLATASSTASSVTDTSSSEASGNDASSDTVNAGSSDEQLHTSAEALQQLVHALTVVYSDAYLLDLALHKTAGKQSCSGVVADKLAATLQQVAQLVPTAVAVVAVQQWLEQLCTAVADAATAAVTDTDAQG